MFEVLTAILICLLNIDSIRKTNISKNICWMIFNLESDHPPLQADLVHHIQTRSSSRLLCHWEEMDEGGGGREGLDMVSERCVNRILHKRGSQVSHWGNAGASQCAHWTFRPYPPIVKNEKYPPFMAHKSKLAPYILTFSDNNLIAIRV